MKYGVQYGLILFTLHMWKLYVQLYFGLTSSIPVISIYRMFPFITNPTSFPRILDFYFFLCVHCVHCTFTLFIDGSSNDICMFKLAVTFISRLKLIIWPPPPIGWWTAIARKHLLVDWFDWHLWGGQRHRPVTINNYINNQNIRPNHENNM